MAILMAKNKSGAQVSQLNYSGQNVPVGCSDNFISWAANTEKLITRAFHSLHMILTYPRKILLNFYLIVFTLLYSPLTHHTVISLLPLPPTPQLWAELILKYSMQS